MSQISPPIRIVLIAVIGLLAAWMLFLRPKTESVPAPAPAPATAPGVTGLTNAADKAKAAGAAQEARDAKVQTATGEKAGDVSTPASGAATQPGPKAASGQAATAAAAKGLPASVQKALDGHKILVLGFFNLKSADDRAVRKALKGADRWDGEVVVRSADVKSVSRYGTIARGAEVEQSPTLIVVDRNAKAETLVGYVDTLTIDQAVVDAMRSSGGLIEDRYLRAVNDVCRTSGQKLFAIPTPTRPGAQVRTGLRRYQSGTARLLTRFKAVKAPARWRGFKRASVADLNGQLAIAKGLRAKVGRGDRIAPILAAVNLYQPRSAKLGARWDARMDKHHVLSCGSNF